MTEFSKKSETEKLHDAIVEGILDLKGIQAVSMHFSKIQNTAFEYFILCNGTSSTHTAAIADSVIKIVNSQCKEKPWHMEGMQNAEWILLDYGNIVVHVFQPEKREFYKLEDLWADADITPLTEKN